jgi:hypothetical protein
MVFLTLGENIADFQFAFAKYMYTYKYALAYICFSGCINHIYLCFVTTNAVFLDYIATIRICNWPVYLIITIK